MPTYGITGAHGRVSLTPEQKGQKLLTVLNRNDQDVIWDAMDLIKAGAKLDEKHMNGGHAALNMAAYRGHERIVRELIQAEANIDENDNFGKTTPLMRAAEKGHVECVKILIEAGAKLDLKDGGKRTARMHAEKEGHAEVAEIIRAAEEKQFIEATDFSKGLEKPIRATKPLTPRRPAP